MMILKKDQVTEEDREFVVEMIHDLMDEEHLFIQEAIKVLSNYYAVSETIISNYLKGSRFDCSVSNYVVCIISGEEFTSSSYSLFVGDKVSKIVRDIIIEKECDIFTACSIFMMAMKIPLTTENYGIIGKILRNAMKRTWGFFADGEFKPRNFVFIKAFKQHARTINYYHKNHSCESIFGSVSTMKALGINI